MVALPPPQGEVCSPSPAGGGSGWGMVRPSSPSRAGGGLLSLPPRGRVAGGAGWGCWMFPRSPPARGGGGAGGGIAARLRMDDALAPLLAASPGSRPPGSPNLSSRFSAAPLVDEAELASFDDRFELGMHAELAAEASNVRPDRCVADPKPGGDSPARQTFGHQTQNLLLTDGQALALGGDSPALRQ